MTKQLREFDPILVETVERALAPYKDKLAPEMIEHFRDEALVLMSTHPYPAALLEQLRKRPPADRSGLVANGAGERDAEAPRKRGEHRGKKERGGRG